MSDSAGAISQYTDAETLLPFGEQLKDIRGTDKAVHVGYYYEDKNKRDHRWIAHMPDYERGSAEYLFVRISTGVSSVDHKHLENASKSLEEPGPPFQDYELVVRDVVDVERTPIPYKKERSVGVRCPECTARGRTHPWKLEDYIPDECPCCGFRGEWNVE